MSQTKPLMSARIAPQIAAYKADLPQTLIMHGEPGVGLRAIAEWLAGDDGEIIEPTTTKTSKTLAIRIETIRELYEQTRSRRGRQIIVLDDAELLTASAQHAFLKLLEEPNEQVHFILVTSQLDQLLPTVRSRAAEVHIPRLEPTTFAAHLDTLRIDDTVRRQIEFVAAGRPELAKQLVDDSERREQLAATMRYARDFIGIDRYQSAIIAARFATSRDKALQLIDAAIAIASHSLQRTPTSDIVVLLRRLDDAHAALRANAQPRLQLMRIVVQ